MAKSDGEKIQITFDEELVNLSVSSCYSSFQIEFNVPVYVVDGGLESATRIPYASDYAPDEVFVSLSSGSGSGIQVIDGVLMLEEI